MGLFAELGIAPGAVKIDDVEKNLASGGLCPPGVHHVRLEAAGPIPNAEDRGSRLTFLVLAGPGEGTTIEEALWKPKGDDPKKDAKTQNRMLIFGHRLGLLQRDANGNLVEVEGKHDFGDCLGAVAFAEVKHEEEEYDEKDKQGKPTGKKKKATRVKLTFDGLLKPDDKRCQGVPTGAVTAPGSVARPAAAAAKPAHYDDL